MPTMHEHNFPQKVPKCRYCADQKGAIVKSPIVKIGKDDDSEVKLSKEPVWAHIT